MAQTTVVPTMADTSAFVGRKDELEALGAMLVSSKLVTVTGAPGVGKSRLIAEHLRIWKRSTRGTAVSLRVEADGTARAAQALATDVESLVPRPLLVVIDDPCGDPTSTVAEMLAADDDLRILVGFDRRLGLAAEATLALAPLPLPPLNQIGVLPTLARQPAMALLLDRAQASAPGFELEPSNALDLVRVCHLADGVPLALEIAATRLRALSARQVRELLERSAILEYGRSEDAAHFPSLSAAVAQAFDRLDADERSLWEAASTFSASFTFDALAQVWQPPSDAGALVDLVTALVDRSVLLVERSGSEILYRMLRPLQIHGRAQAAVHGGLSILLERQLDTIVELSADAAAGVFGARQADWFARFSRERVTIIDALREAAARGLISTDRLVQTVAALRFFWITTDDVVPARALLITAIERGAPTLAGQGEAHWVDAFLCVLSGELAAARRALAAGRKTRTASQRNLDFVAALIDLAAGDPEAGDRRLAQLRHTSAGSLPTDPIQGEILFYEGIAKFLRNDLAGLDDVCAEAWDEDYVSDRWAHAYMQALAALATWRRGGHGEARDQLTGVIRVFEEHQDRSGMALAMTMMSWVELDAGNAAHAAELYGAAAPLSPIARTLLRSAVDKESARLRDAVGEEEFDNMTARGAVAGIVATAAALTGTSRTSVSRDRYGLSGREFEIAGLIASGLTNAEIAQKLVISRRTVEGHVQRVLGKLDFTSRTQVATWFVQFVEVAQDRGGPQNREI